MHKRIPLLNDFFGFTAASLGDKVRSGSGSCVSGGCSLCDAVHR